ncbi:MAG: SAM-dependent methyltransferase [Zetaproteobacteria bacterium CG_4_10_14_0_2_um_filter_55_20]|nr:MAG: SAM-dependent methyltransferase [Zetaproteobacteria bacterium CG_4_10_14_0_8_um_filter_55_43]PIZ39265.1 MAG: SAM-dependent methyltransferase [Zetaproteobacteria bacterium CG_4_10_14_0_2_um_filter_55_20]
MPCNLFDQYLTIWKRKKVLRLIYEDYYKRLISFSVQGMSLEIGGGSGNLKGYLKDVVSTDIVPSPWLDLAADAQQLPFRDDVFSNVICVDVVHHIESPVCFFKEAFRVLKPGGRIIFLEPAMTPLAKMFYMHFHPEPVDMSADPFAQVVPSPDRQPFDANQAIPTLLFRDNYKKFTRVFPTQRLLAIDWISLLAYPLSGGFRPWSLIPSWLVGPVLAFESIVPSWLRQWAAFRMLVVLEKQA